MTFDPDVDKLFRLMLASGVPPLARQSVEQARLYYREKTIRLGGPLAPMSEIRDLHAEGPEGPIPLRLYCPQEASDSGAALIYVHGGGWVLGDLESHEKVCRNIAAVGGCRVVAIDYRLAPEHPFPAGLDDVLAATQWIFVHAVSLGIDKDRIGIGGDSAGGSMAAAACLAVREDGPSLRCQVLIYPSTDSTPEVRHRASRIQYAKVPPITAEAMKWFSSKYLPEGLPQPSDWRLSPLYADSLSALPPALVMTAGCDPLRDEGKAFADRLHESGVLVVYLDFPGQIHGFIEYGGILAAAGIAVEEIAKFLQHTL